MNECCKPLSVSEQACLEELYKVRELYAEEDESASVEAFDQCISLYENHLRMSFEEWQDALQIGLTEMIPAKVKRLHGL